MVKEGLPVPGVEARADKFNVRGSLRG